MPLKYIFTGQINMGFKSSLCPACAPQIKENPVRLRLKIPLALKYICRCVSNETRVSYMQLSATYFRTISHLRSKGLDADKDFEKD